MSDLLASEYWKARETIASLQRELEEAKKDLFQNKAKAIHLASALRFKEESGGVQIVPAMEAYADTIVEEWKLKLAASEAKCERMKEAIGKLTDFLTLEVDYIDSDEERKVKDEINILSETLSEPLSNSLDLYHKERNKKELGEVVELIPTLEELEYDFTEGVVFDDYDRVTQQLVAFKKALSILKRLTD